MYASTAEEQNCIDCHADLVGRIATYLHRRG